MLTSGVLRNISYAKETEFGVKPAAKTGKLIRRVSAEINLTRETFESAEITSTAQTSDMRSGSDAVEGSISTELSSGSYADFFAALLRGTWADGVTFTGNIGVSAGAFTDAANGFVTKGFKVGDVISTSGFTNTKANGRFVITKVVAGELSVDGLEGVTEAAASGRTVKVAGKKLAIPKETRTDDSFTIESWFTNLQVSEVATGVKFSECEISIQPNAMATANFSLMGKTVESKTGSDARYFTSNTPAPTSSVLSGSNGALYVDGKKIATVTAFSSNITGNMEAATVVGSRQTSDIFLGRIGVTGEFSAYFDSQELFNKFVNEEDLTVVFQLNGDGDDMFSIKLPRIKIGGVNKSDGETGGVVQTVPFTALFPHPSDVQDQSTIVLQENFTV